MNNILAVAGVVIKEACRRKDLYVLLPAPGTIDKQTEELKQSISKGKPGIPENPTATQNKNS